MTGAEILTEINVTKHLIEKSGNNPSILIDLRIRLCTQAYTLAEFIGKLTRQHLEAKFDRKIKIAKSQNKLINEGMPVSKSEVQAIADNEGAMGEERDTEGMLKNCTRILVQTNEISSALSQKISFLRSEMQNTKQLT